MGKSKFFNLFLCLFLCFSFTIKDTFAQTAKYFVEFTDKNNSPFSIGRPTDYLSERAIQRRINQGISLSSRDLPVNPAYVNTIQEAGATIWYTSKWMNAALIEADSLTMESIITLPFVKEPQDNNWQRVARVRKSSKGSTKEAGPTYVYPQGQKEKSFALNYGLSANQVSMMGADEMHKSGFTGKGMYIAVFDSGFRNANKLQGLKHIFQDNRMLGTYDFVANETSVYEDDSHGLSVFSAMAAYQPGELIGTAFEASYFLFRTEDASSETRVEEINWLIAAEQADSAGVDVINASLGYNLFDFSYMNYQPWDMKGNTAFITRAADMAASTGMLVVTSAGNEGNDSWRVITAPADGDSVLAVGAVDRAGNYAKFSSVGLAQGGKVKPNLVVQGQGVVLLGSDGNVKSSNGTSFSSPLLAGMAASFWQAYPQLTNMEVISFLQRSASQYEKADTLLGYGIPNFTKASRLAEEYVSLHKNNVSVWPNPLPTGKNELTIYISKNYNKEPVKLEFFDRRGSLIYEQVLKIGKEKNTFFLSPSLFKAGLYLLRISSPGFSVVTKVVRL